MFPPSPERKERIVTIERNANLGVFDQSRIEKIARETQRRTQARTLDDQNRLAITFRNGADHVVPLKRSALQQLANATRVPATFLSRLTDAGHHDLAAATLAELSTVAPAAEVEIRMHVGSCKDSDCPASNVYRAGLMARVDLGEGLEVTREYAL